MVVLFKLIFLLLPTQIYEFPVDFCSIFRWNFFRKKFMSPKEPPSDFMRGPCKSLLHSRSSRDLNRGNLAPVNFYAKSGATVKCRTIKSAEVFLNEVECLLESFRVIVDNRPGDFVVSKYIFVFRNGYPNHI